MQEAQIEKRLREIANPNAHPCLMVVAADTIAHLREQVLSLNEALRTSLVAHAMEISGWRDDQKENLPDYLHERLADAMDLLTKEIIK